MKHPETAPAARPAPPPTGPATFRSAKVRPAHLDRLAIVYVRQSSPHQVLHHRESRARQYALADYAVALGWPPQRVLVLDEDQGQSGQAAATRAGFHRLLAEVTMEHAGLVLALEMSRLARSSQDWHQLLQLCALFGTLLADEDGVYDPRDANDRLLLGLKGTISEFETVTMRNRLERGRLNKAQRGALFHRVPTGYVKVSPDRVELDPDEQVRAVVRLIFDKYDELGSVRGLLRYLLRHDLRLGIRPATGPRRGQLEWRRPCLPTLHQILHHPIYAGAYVYGRRQRGRGRGEAGPDQATVRLLPMAQWSVLRRDGLPAYISWERYLQNQERLRQHRTSAATPGAPRPGAALLAGLVACGTCGRRLRPSYHHGPYYVCDRHQRDGTPKVCSGLSAHGIDDLVAQQVLRALQPAALELSLRAVEDVEAERARLDRHWQQRLRRVRYEAQEAERRYRAVDAENRLVAHTLEQGWEEALRALRQAEEDYDRFVREKPCPLSVEERAGIRALASDIPALWRAPETTPQDRKEIIRLLLERVVVHVRQDSEYADVTLHWRGGCTSRHRVVRPVQAYTQLRDYEQLLGRIVELRRAGQTAARIAAALNQEGFSPPRRRGGFSKELVRQLLSRRGLADERTYADQLNPHEWWLPELAREIGVPAVTLRHWRRQGWVHARQTPAQGVWILWADGREQKRLRQLAALSHRGAKDYPAKLTTPAKRARR
jgi:DNA invertase Pin-like site-specific DNA recombinase/DNA-binding transcriptional MerR regulator